MKKLLAKLFLTFLFYASQSFSLDSFASEITVAAAANVQYALEELKAEFEKENPGIIVKTITGSSGKLTAQIENGAPFDVFMSADMNYPHALKKKGLVYQEPKIYAYGILVLWTIKDIDLSTEVIALTNFAVKKIACPNPETAPYGYQAIDSLKYFKLYERVKSRLVYGESIAQVNQFITTGAADIGFTAKSIVMSPDLKNKCKWIDVDQDSYEKIAQGVVMLKYAKKHNMPAVQAFFDFLFSGPGRNIFKKYGYTLP